MAQSTDKTLTKLIINQMPRSVYNAKKAAGELDPEQVYLPDAAYDDSLGVTDAVPGKTIKVKAVQGGKPTEWETADIYEKPASGIPKSDLAEDVQTSLNRADRAYTKPASGIPKSDLEQSVQTSLAKADNAVLCTPQSLTDEIQEQARTNIGAYTKPTSGIPKSDLEQSVQTSLAKADTAISLGLTAASPGQIIKVKTVQDGKPTEWEAGDGGVQPDWNQNDSTQPDYIKNRPFYTGDPVETVLVEERTVPFADASGLYIGELESTFEATVGETYKVSWDGTTYECVCVGLDGIAVIGNLSIAGPGSDTGEPFVIFVDGTIIRIGTTDTSASHTLYIRGPVTPIIKIPAKFIDKDASGYIVVHNSRTMTEEEVRNYRMAISKGEAVFIIWESLYISKISVQKNTDSTGVSVVYLYVNIPNGESYKIAQNSEGLFNLNDRELVQATFPDNRVVGDGSPLINIVKGKIRITPSVSYSGVGTTDVLFYVEPNGIKSKAFEVLGNGEAVAPALILYSSTADSTKKFRITVDDNGIPTITDESDSTNTWKPTNLPTVTTSDAGKFLRVSDTGEWVAETILSASGVSF